MRCDVSLEEGGYQQNCLCATVLSPIIMVDNGTSSFTGQLDLAYVLLGLAVGLLSASSNR